MVGNDILSADIARYAHNIRSDTMGIFIAAQVGRSVGEMADTLSDSTFLRSHALLRGIISMCNTLIISVVILQNTST